jgi:hypothetical protein
MSGVVNLRDTHGVLPQGAIRICRPSRWGNPYPVGKVFTRDNAIASYRTWLAARLEAEPNYLEPLRGKVLACWCHGDETDPLPCHGDAIIEWLETHPR